MAAVFLNRTTAFAAASFPAGTLPKERRGDADRYRPQVDQVRVWGSRNAAQVSAVTAGLREAETRDYSIPAGGGVIGGPMIVKIDCFDGVSKDLGGEVVANGSALFEAYEVRVDIEKKNGKKDFEFDKAATGPPASFDPSDATRR